MDGVFGKRLKSFLLLFSQEKGIMFLYYTRSGLITQKFYRYISTYYEIYGFIMPFLYLFGYYILKIITPSECVGVRR